MAKNIYIYGTGRIGNRYYNTLNNNQLNVLGFIETKKTMDTFRSLPVYSLTDAIENRFDEIHVANTYLDTLLALLAQKVDTDKIVICNFDLYLQYAAYCNGKVDIKVGVPMVLTQPHLNEHITNTENICLQDNLIFGNMDYCRYGALQLAINEIKRNNVQGTIAELGVFRGEFAKLLNEMLPDRDLFLFDTFEGFAPEEVAYEKQRKFAKDEIFIGDRDFKNTSIELVLSKMKHPEKCIVRKGKFPDTTPAEDYQYAFVSIDCDLYLPVLEGLRYFYPRLSTGGYIMLHDYNSNEFLGMRQAVEECEHLFGHIIKVPIPDKYGSLIISK